MEGEITADGFETSDRANERESLEEGGFGCRVNIIVDRLGETIGRYRVEKSILSQRINMTNFVHVLDEESTVFKCDGKEKTGGEKVKDKSTKIGKKKGKK